PPQDDDWNQTGGGSVRPLRRAADGASYQEIKRAADRRKRCGTPEPVERGFCTPQPGSQRGPELLRGKRSLRGNGVNYRAASRSDYRTATPRRGRESLAGIH